MKRNKKHLYFTYTNETVIQEAKNWKRFGGARINAFIWFFVSGLYFFFTADSASGETLFDAVYGAASILTSILLLIFPYFISLIEITLSVIGYGYNLFTNTKFALITTSILLFHLFLLIPVWQVENMKRRMKKLEHKQNNQSNPL